MKITHVLQDGTELDSLEDYQVPLNNQTKAYYEFLANLIIEQQKSPLQQIKGLIKNTPKL